MCLAWDERVGSISSDVLGSWGAFLVKPGLCMCLTPRIDSTLRNGHDVSVLIEDIRVLMIGHSEQLVDKGGLPPRCLFKTSHGMVPLEI